MFKKKQRDQEEEVILLSDEDVEESDSLIEPGHGGGKARKKLPGWVIIPILLVLILAFFGISRLANGKQDVGMQFATAEVKKENVKDIYSTSGMVEGEKIKVYCSPVNAPVLDMNAKVGEPIKAGDMLLTFDTTNLERDNQQSELNTLSAKYTNQDAKEQSRRAAKSSSNAQVQAAASIQNLQNQINTKQAEVSKRWEEANAQAGADASKAEKANELRQRMLDNQNEQSTQKAKKDNAERELKNMDSTNAQYVTLMQQAQEATNKLSALEIEYRSMEAEMAQNEASGGSDLYQMAAAAEQELNTLKASLSELQNSAVPSEETGLTAGQVNSMQVSESLAELAQLTTDELLNKGREGIKADFNGIVSDIKCEVGTGAVQGAELLTIVSNDDVNVKLEISASDFNNIAIGNKAEIKLGKKIYKGTLVSIDKIALPNEKGNSVIGAKVHIENPDEGVYIGVNAKVALTAAEKKNVPCIPNEAINTSTEGDFVYIIQNGTIKKQKVELGVTSSSKSEVIKGLKEGDEVVTDTSGTIKEGMKATGVSGNKKTSSKE